MCQPNVSDPSIKEFSDRIIRIQKLKIALAADIIKEDEIRKSIREKILKIEDLERSVSRSLQHKNLQVWPVIIEMPSGDDES